MFIGIIDADLLANITTHRFPNLACMKISNWHKSKGDVVELVLNYDEADVLYYDVLYVSKVFTKTFVPDALLTYDNVRYGGTGFFYENAPPLPDEIEHIFPDYHLYDTWVKDRLESGEKKERFSYYMDFSIGYTTRGCTRQCQFCVNKNKTSVITHSPVDEFLDKKRKYICLLDDNVLMSKDWKSIFISLQKTGKRFQYKQGLDERALTEDKIKTLLKCKYLGDYIFAFDNIGDKKIIEEKLKLWQSMDSDNKRLKFYVLCGFDRDGKWDDEFWLKDIYNTFLRIEILMRHRALPYIMRYENVYSSIYSDIYTQIAGWCNQPSLFKNMSFEEFCVKKGISEKVYNIYKNSPIEYLENGGKKGKPWRTLDSLRTMEIEDLERFITMKYPK